MLYVLVLLALAALLYIVLRSVRAQANRPKTRVIGPDDDPDFLSRLSRDDNNPR